MKLNNFSVELSMRKDLFDRVAKFVELNPGMEGLSDEQKRFVEKEIVHGKRNGG